MRYDVPQFIDIEDKIIGPFTFKQSIYLAGSAGVGFIIFSTLSNLSFEIPFILKIILSVPPMALGAALAFLKINKRKLIFYLESFFKYMINPKQYVWKKKDKKAKVRGHKQIEKQAVNVNPQYVPKVTKSKIKDLALSLDMELDNKLDEIMN